VKFSLWPFRRKKIRAENAEGAVQHRENIETSGVELEPIADSVISRIVAPEVLPILGEADGWNKMRIGQSVRLPGVMPIEEHLEVSEAQGLFKPLIEPGNFTRSLSGLSSFNISQILGGKNEAPGFPDELPTLGDGLTDVLAQPGSLPEQIPGMAGLAPILSVSQPMANREAVEPSGDEPEQPSRPEITRVQPLTPGLRPLSLERKKQGADPTTGPANLPLINSQLPDLISSNDRDEPGMKVSCLPAA